MEIGITGGEEDGVDNSDVDQDKLYTSPEQVWNIYQALSPISDMFSIAGECTEGIVLYQDTWHHH